MMKKITLLLLGLAAMTTVPAKVKTVSVSRPAFAYSFQNALVPTEVVASDTATVVSFRANAMGSWRIGPQACLKVGNQTLPLRHGTASQVKPGREQDEPTVVPFQPDSTYLGYYAAFQQEGAKVTVGLTLVFPPLPKRTKVFAFDEGIDDPQKFCVTGIRLDGKTYPDRLNLNDAQSTVPLAWTAPADGKAKPCRIRVRVVGSELPAGLTFTPGFYTVSEAPFHKSLTEPTWEPAADGTPGGTVTLSSAVPVGCLVYLRNSRNDLYGVPCLPGEDLTLTVDYNALTRLETTPGATPSTVPYYTLTDAAGRQLNPGVEGPDGWVDLAKAKTADLVHCASNPEVARLRLAERDAAEALFQRIGALEDVSPAEVAATAEAYRETVETAYTEALTIKQKREAGEGGKVCEAPDVPMKDMIKAIAARYAGKVVYIDLWATWCAPCRMGIEAMKPHHADFAPDDVQFVYITNESSPMDKWNKMLLDMPGDHYRLPSFEGMEPAVQGIPRYLILDRAGNVVFDKAGFGPGMEKEFCKTIQETIDKK